MDREKRARVLVAEDDFLVGEMIQAQLEQLGYRVAGKAVDTQQVVELAQSLQPDVILMDIGMPGADGIYATQRIQACCPTPVVVLTAFFDSPFWQRSPHSSATGSGTSTSSEQSRGPDAGSRFRPGEAGALDLRGP